MELSGGSFLTSMPVLAGMAGAELQRYFFRRVLNCRRSWVSWLRCLLMVPALLLKGRSCWQIFFRESLRILMLRICLQSSRVKSRILSEVCLIVVSTVVIWSFKVDTWTYRLTSLYGCYSKILIIQLYQMQSEIFIYQFQIQKKLQEKSQRLLSIINSIKTFYQYNSLITGS